MDSSRLEIPFTSNKKSTKREIKKIVSHKGMSDIQKIEMEERQQRREERRERASMLQRGMSTGVTDQERDPLDSGHDRQEEGVEEEASPSEEELWIEQPEAL